jgi:DNA-binding response OmpR family regulator
MMDKEGEPQAARVLVVDDDPSITRALQMVLEQAGFRVSVAQDGQEALEKMSPDKPDILFLDLMMPEMSGFDVLKEMENRQLLGGMRIFIFTAKHLTPQQIGYLEQRAERVIQKGSLRLTEMVSLLKENLGSN